MYTKYKIPNTKYRLGFTLIELLIVIGILAVLSTATVLMLNPADMLAETRDSARMTDLNTINQALGLYQYYSASSFGAANTIYISIPRAVADDCGYGTGNPLGLPSIPAGYSYACKDTATYRKIDGTGWIPVDFTQISGGSPLASLPIDPVNNASQGLYYSYIGGSWTLNSMLESSKYLSAKAKTDGGVDDARYELGHNLSLWTNASGLVGYWRMDESSWVNNCSTLTVTDSSGNANHGKSCPNGTGPLGGAAGKVGNAGSFDGVNDYAIINNNFVVNPTSLTISAWFKKVGAGSNYECVLHRGSDSSIGNSEYWLGVDLDDYLTATIGARTGVGWAAGKTTIKTTLGTWYHLLASWNGSVVKVYINGEYIKQYSLTSYSNLTTPTRFGASADGTNYQFNGVIDEVRIYNRALSAMEVKAIYNATK